MPAPRPIEFAAPVGPLGELAVAAGRAEGTRREFERQQAIDTRFLRDELNRRHDQAQFEADFQQRQQIIDARKKGEAMLPTGPLRRAGQARMAAAGTAPAIAAAIPAAVRDPLAPTARGSITTNRGTFRFDAAGKLRRESPEPGRELATPSGEFNPSNLPDEFRDRPGLTRDRSVTPQFVRGAPNDRVPISIAKQLQVLSQANLTDESRQVLEATIRTGGFKDSGELFEQIQQERPGATDPAKVNQRALERTEQELDILHRQFAQAEDLDPGGVRATLLKQRIAERKEDLVRQRYIADAPQFTGRSLANPNPNPMGGTTLTQDAAMQFLQQAGGDKHVARQMALDAGFVIPNAAPDPGAPRFQSSPGSIINSPQP